MVAAKDYEKDTGSSEPMSALYRGYPPDDEFADLMDEIVASRPKTYDRADPFEDD